MARSRPSIIQRLIDDSARSAPDFADDLILPDPPLGLRRPIVGFRQVASPFKPVYPIMANIWRLING